MPEAAPAHPWWQRPLGSRGWHPVSPHLGEWHHLFEGFDAQPSEIYAAVKEAVGRRRLPDVSFSEVVFREAGIGSAGRAYLRISREHHVFDFCAAPYGTGFFLSWWLAEARPSRFWPTLATIFYSALFVSFYVEHWGFVGLTFAIALMLAGFALLGALIAQSPGERWGQYVLVIPLLGWLIRVLFLPPTYFRMDTAIMFRTSLEQAVKEVVTGLAETKGIRAPTADEWKPIMRDLARR